MSAFFKEAKDILIRFGKFVSSRTGMLVKNVRFKYKEWSELGKRRDLITELGKHVYALSKEGVSLPAETASEIGQLNALDQNLTLLRDAHAADVATFDAQKAAAKAAAAEKKAAAKLAAQAQATSAQAEAPVAHEKTEPEAPAPQAPTMAMPEETPAGETTDSSAPTLDL